MPAASSADGAAGAGGIPRMPFLDKAAGEAERTAAAVAAAFKETATGAGNFQELAAQMVIMNATLVGLKSKNDELELKLHKLSEDKPHDKVEPEETKEEAVLKRLDRKDVDKPGKYGGNADHWLKWSKAFKKFLERQDTRWPAILDAVAERPCAPLQRGNPFIAADDASLQHDASLGNGSQLDLFKEQLNEYLENYTSGSAKAMVEACGDLKAFDPWRQLADKGHSLREAHVHVLRRKAYFPKACTSAKDIENHLNSWGADLELFLNAAGEKLLIGNRLMLVVDLCPDPMRKHLKDNE